MVGQRLIREMPHPAETWHVRGGRPLVTQRSSAAQGLQPVCLQQLAIALPTNWQVAVTKVAEARTLSSPANRHPSAATLARNYPGRTRQPSSCKMFGMTRFLPALLVVALAASPAAPQKSQARRAVLNITVVE